MASAAPIAMELSFDDQLGAALNRAIDGMEDLSPVMRQISNMMALETLDRFDNEHDPLGVPWKKSQRAIEKGGKTLYEKGALRDNIKDDVGPTHAAIGVDRVAGNIGRRPVGDYAAIHQFGGTIRPKHKKALSFSGRIVAQVVMPRRAYLGFGETEKREIPQMLGAYLSKLFRGSDQ
jgi:phage virion morphogenesis protein